MTRCTNDAGPLLHRAHGLLVEAEHPLPAFARVDDDLSLHRETEAHESGEAATRPGANDDAPGERLRIEERVRLLDDGESSGGVTLQVLDDGGLRIRHGRRVALTATGGRHVLVERAPEVNEDEASHFLTGWGMAAILQQRGRLPLHGAALSRNGRAVLVVASGRGGKSSCAAALLEQGFELLDDNLVSPVVDDGSPRIHGGSRRLHVWARSLAALGADPRDHALMRRDGDKHVVLTPGASTPARLVAICHLVPAAVDDPTLRPLEGKAAFAALRSQVFGGPSLWAQAPEGHRLARLATLLRAVPVHELRRPRLATPDDLVGRDGEAFLRRLGRSIRATAGLVASLVPASAAQRRAPDMEPLQQ